MKQSPPLRTAGLTPSLLLLPGAAAAQGLAESLSTNVETNVSANSATTRDGTGNETRGESTNVLPRLTVTADTLLFPSLRRSRSSPRTPKCASAAKS